RRVRVVRLVGPAAGDGGDPDHQDERADRPPPLLPVPRAQRLGVRPRRLRRRPGLLPRRRGRGRVRPGPWAVQSCCGAPCGGAPWGSWVLIACPLLYLSAAVCEVRRGCDAADRRRAGTIA